MAHVTKWRIAEVPLWQSDDLDKTCGMLHAHWDLIWRLGFNIFKPDQTVERYSNRYEQKPWKMFKMVQFYFPPICRRRRNFTLDNAQGYTTSLAWSILPICTIFKTRNLPKVSWESYKNGLLNYNMNLLCFNFNTVEPRYLSSCRNGLVSPLKFKKFLFQKKL